MLVLSRQRDETIMIGDDVEITIVDIRGDKVRLGVTAPTRIAVHRKEVYEAIRIENQRAATIRRDDVQRLGSSPAAGRSDARVARLTGRASDAAVGGDRNPGEREERRSA